MDYNVLQCLSRLIEFVWIWGHTYGWYVNHCLSCVLSIDNYVLIYLSSLMIYVTYTNILGGEKEMGEFSHIVTCVIV